MSHWWCDDQRLAPCALKTFVNSVLRTISLVSYSGRNQNRTHVSRCTHKRANTRSTRPSGIIYSGRLQLARLIALTVDRYLMENSSPTMHPSAICLGHSGWGSCGAGSIYIEKQTSLDSSVSLRTIQTALLTPKANVSDPICLHNTKQTPTS